MGKCVKWQWVSSTVNEPSLYGRDTNLTNRQRDTPGSIHKKMFTTACAFWNTHRGNCSSIGISYVTERLKILTHQKEIAFVWIWSLSRKTTTCKFHDTFRCWQRMVMKRNQTVLAWSFHNVYQSVIIAAPFPAWELKEIRVDRHRRQMYTAQWHGSTALLLELMKLFPNKKSSLPFFPCKKNLGIFNASKQRKKRSLTF